MGQDAEQSLRDFRERRISVFLNRRQHGLAFGFVRGCPQEWGRDEPQN